MKKLLCRWLEKYRKYRIDKENDMLEKMCKEIVYELKSGEEIKNMPNRAKLPKI